MEDNWLDGGACTLNFAHRNGQPLTGIYVVGNRFGWHSSLGIFGESAVSNCWEATLSLKMLR